MKNIIIVGANQGIGLGLFQILSSQSNTNVIIASREYGEQIIGSNRVWKIKCDLTSESSIQNFFEQVQSHFQCVDWLINCAGVLHTDDYLPEKILSKINAQQLIENYQVNAMGHLLLLKKMEKLIAASDNPIVTSISARIGSIKDNQLGGWYSYRMSKAALNMGFKTLEIEWRRKYPHIQLLLVHPGTTDTELSKPFQKRLAAGKLQTIEQTSQLIIEQINRKQQGQLDSLFIDFNGIEIEW
jgi:NAD(P)-dependent dehydrogenase (short-subunit alcohol dehydrogenase family)